MEEARVKAFHALKPPCVELSQVALRCKGKRATRNDLVKSLENVKETLRAVSKQPNALDSKLAEYAFFPLSHIFRDTKDLPVRAVELALQCLQILIAYGWQGQLSSQLGKQLLILLCFLAGGSATDAKVKDVNEELGTITFECLASLFEASKGTFLGTDTIEPENVPILGHSVTVILDGITDGPSVKVRLGALASLGNLIECLTDFEALKNVLPGIVSSLTKGLSLKSGSKPSFKVLTASLNILAKVICQVIRDDRMGDHIDAKRLLENGNGTTGSWAVATAGQIKMALASTLPLRYYERIEVRTGLFELCVSIIQQCRSSLAQSVPMLTETLVVICSQSSETYTTGIFTLGSILAHDAGLLDIVKGSLHDWIVGLPRIMQSNDDIRKVRIIEQVSMAFKILANNDMSFEVLNDSVATNLRASVSSAIPASSNPIHPVSESGMEVTQILHSTNATSRSITFPPILFGESRNNIAMNCLQSLAIQLKALPTSINLQHDVVSTLRTTSGDEQLAGLWLSLQFLTETTDSASIIDQFLNLPQELEIRQPFLDDIYAFSLDILSTSTFEDEDRWKLQSLALEVVALQAQQQKYDFRPELVDALYPILERLGSNNAALQQHAMICLNVVADACDYPNSAALIVNNADYLVNAVALKLNTFDLSPQAPQVLVMMVKLSGWALIPYLDDLVESIFSILACYHGYPKLVESLFSVLNAIVEEAAKASTHAITSDNETTTRPQAYHSTTISDLASLLRSKLEASTRPLAPPSSPPPEPTTTSDPPEDRDPPTPPRSTTPPPVPLSKTHTLVKSIASLTPAHLTTPSAPLRAGILTLLTSALPVLATNTDTFLPLAATLWPAITARLYDAEAYTTLAAANALTTLCTCAGDFVAQRVEDEWPRLCRLYARVQREMREEARVQGRRSQARGMRWKVWDGVVGLIVTIVRDVGADGELEDGVFEILGGLVSDRPDVREVLEGLNADALWLVEEQARIKGGGSALGKPEALEGVEFRDVRL